MMVIVGQGDIFTFNISIFLPVTFRYFEVLLAPLSVLVILAFLIYSNNIAAFGGVFLNITAAILNDENSTTSQNLPPKSDHLTLKFICGFYLVMDSYVSENILKAPSGL